MNVLNKSLLRSCIVKSNFRNLSSHFVRLKDFSNIFGAKRVFLRGRSRYSTLSEHNLFEYNSTDLARIVNKLKSLETPTITESNVLENLLKFCQQNDIRTKDDAMFFINSVIYISKSNQNVSENGIGERKLEEILANFEPHIGQMSFDETISTMIGLNLIHVPLHHPIFRTLTIRTANQLKELNDVPLQSLTNFAILARQHADKMYPYHLCADGTSHIIKHLNQCQTIDDLYLITIYLEKLKKFVTKDMMTLHKMKMKSLMADFDPKQNTDQIIKIMTFYRYLQSAYKNSRIIKNLLLLIANEIPNLSNEQLQRVANLQDMLNEPVSIVPRILEVAESRPNKSTDINLLYCRSATHLPDAVEKISTEISHYINLIDAKDISKNHVLIAILTYRGHLNLSKFNQIYWKKIIEDLSTNILTHRETDTLLAIYSNRYCLSNQRFSHGAQCPEFEAKFGELAIMDIKYGTAATLPYQLANLARFLLNLASTQPNGIELISESLVQKIERMAPQFSINEIIDISAGVEQCFRNNVQKNACRRKSFRVLDHLNRLGNVVSECIERLLDDRPNLQIDSLCLLIRAHTTHRVLKHDRTLARLLKQLRKFCSSNEIIITPYTINNATRCLYRVSYAVPELCEKMLHYVNENKDTVSAETMTRLLYYLFAVGYEPNRENNFSRINAMSNGNKTDKNIDPDKLLNSDLFDFESFAQIINRDFNLMPAWLIVQACLALGYYEALPIDLINRVFNMDFIVRLEKEMAANCDRSSYPKNILTSIMRLNRAVCLDYPEAAIPWFQQNFIEAQLTAFKPRQSAYFGDVYDMLLKLVGGDKTMIRLNHVTPYGYRVPFVIYFNSQKQLVSPPLDEGSQILNKVAIMPLLDKHYCLNEERRIRGGMLMEERHLGILGYDVIQICYREWNSMHMNLPGAREKLLRSILKNYKLLTQ